MGMQQFFDSNLLCVLLFILLKAKVLFVYFSIHILFSIPWKRISTFFDEEIHYVKCHNIFITNNFRLENALHNLKLQLTLNLVNERNWKEIFERNRRYYKIAESQFTLQYPVKDATSANVATFLWVLKGKFNIL